MYTLLCAFAPLREIKNLQSTALTQNFIWKISVFTIALGLAIAVNSCLPQCPPQKVYFQGEAQGTYYTVTYFDREGRNFQHEVDSILKAFDQSVSMWVPNSIISSINNNEDVEVDAWFREIFTMAKKVCSETNGAFDMTIGPLVNAWGFGFEDRMQLDKQKVDSLLKWVDYTAVSLNGNRITKAHDNIRFDFNAIAQGYSVDLLAGFLSDKGISDFLVDIGGEVLGKGSKPDGTTWRVGVEKPAEDSASGRQIQAIVALQNKALATSGNYRKFYIENGIRYAHTIDPKTGYPVQHSLLSVSVLAENCALADAYATAFMVMGLEKSIEFLDSRDDLEAYFIYATDNENFEVVMTDGFEEILVE